MQSTRIENPAVKTVKRMRALSRRALLPVLLAFLFTFVLGAGLVHNHDGDLQQQFDCNICLKSGSNNDIAANTEHYFNFQRLSIEFLQPLTLAPLYRIVPAKSRSPPNA